MTRKRKITKEKEEKNKKVKSSKTEEKRKSIELLLADGKQRCEFSYNPKTKIPEITMAYHDERWCKPVHDENELYAMLVLETMQAGLSWSTILEKEENYRNSFDKLIPKIVATYNEDKIKELMNNPGIIRNRKKIESIINNAKAFLKVQKEFGSFDKYIWSFTDGKTIDNKYKDLKDIPPKSELSEKVSKDLKSKGFQFVGPTSIYSYLQGIGILNDHTINCEFR